MTKLFATKELKAARVRKGWSQDELASMLRAQAGIRASQSAVQKWENGVKPVVPDTALELARMLHVGVDKIVERREV